MVISWDIKDLMGIPSGVIKHGRLRNHHKLHVLMVTFKNIRLQWNGWRTPGDVRMISHWSGTSFEMPMRPGELEGINTNPSNQHQTCWTCCWHDFEPGRIPNASYFWGNRQAKKNTARCPHCGGPLLLVLPWWLLPLHLPGKSGGQGIWCSFCLLSDF